MALMTAADAPIAPASRTLDAERIARTQRRGVRQLETTASRRRAAWCKSMNGRGREWPELS